MLRDVRDTAPDIIFRDVDSDLCKHTVYLRRGAMNQSTMEFNSDTWHDTRGKCEKPMGTHKQYPQLEPKWLRTIAPLEAFAGRFACSGEGDVCGRPIQMGRT